MSPRARALAVALIALVLLPALAAACPLCKDALEDKTTGLTNELGRGFYYSILLMVSAPFLVVGGIFLQIVRLRRKAHLAAGASEGAPPRLLAGVPGARS